MPTLENLSPAFRPPHAWKPATLDGQAFAAVLGVMCVCVVALFVAIAAPVADRAFGDIARIDPGAVTEVAAAASDNAAASLE